MSGSDLETAARSGFAITTVLVNNSAMATYEGGAAGQIGVEARTFPTTGPSRLVLSVWISCHFPPPDHPHSLTRSLARSFDFADDAGAGLGQRYARSESSGCRAVNAMGGEHDDRRLCGNRRGHGSSRDHLQPRRRVGVSNSPPRPINPRRSPR